MRRRDFITAGSGLAAMATWPGKAGAVELSVPGVARSQARISFNPNSPIGQIGATFLGLSYEKAELSNPLFSASDVNLVALFRALGQGVLRIGGNSVDKTSWTPNGPGLQAGYTAPADIARLAGFVAATNWQVIYGVNMAAADAQGSAAEAAAVARAIGNNLLGIEIGNECDLYAGNYRPASYDFAQFSSEWAGFASAIRSASPGTALTGPASASHVSTFTVPFAGSHGRDILLLTQHYYRANGQAPSSTLALLLQSDPALAGEVSTLVNAASANAIPLGVRLAEANSFYNGGAPNISDSFGSALWLLDFLISLAQSGASGVNFHGGGSGPGYTPIADNGSAPLETRPEYDALLLFSRLSGGQILPIQTAAGGLNFNALAVLTAAAKASVLIVNKEMAETIRVNVGPLPGRLQIWRLSGTLGLKTGVTLGGAAVPPDGSWNGSATPIVSNARSATVAVEIPAGSAALIETL